MIQVDATMCGFSGLFQNTAVSIFGDENSDANKKSKANALAYIQPKRTTVEFYQAETSPVWV